MANWKSNLIDAYRVLSGPIRIPRLAFMKRSGTVPVAILYYHRVDDDNPNPWTISEQAFAQHIDWFQENFDLVSLEECQNRIKSGYNDRPTLSITFDDGYADNSAFALPMLIERGIPVTYFVTTEHIVHGKPFPHDVKLGEPLLPNSIDSLRALAQAGVEIGGHTRTHIDLGSVTNYEQLVDEVIIATQEMSALIERKIRYFAFPFGMRENLNPTVFRMLHDYGFKGVCSAYGGMNEVGSDEFHLQRIHGDPNFSRMRNWLTFDPRIKSVKRYDYKTEPEIVSNSGQAKPNHAVEPVAVD